MAADIALIEKLAFLNREMPGNLDFVEQMLFIALRYLYQGHSYGYLDKDRAKREKSRVMQQYKFYKFHSDLYIETAKMRNRLSYYLIDINKNGCEYCKKAVAIFTDMDKGQGYVLDRIKTGRKLTVAEWVDRELSQSEYDKFIQTLIAENDFEHPSYDEWRGELEPETIQEANEKQVKGELL